MNKSKTKVMMENDTPIYVQTLSSRTLTVTSTWDKNTSTRDKNQDKEIQRRTMAGWTAFAKHRDIFKGHIGICLKRQVYNPSMLNITCRDRNFNLLWSLMSKMSTTFRSVSYGPYSRTDFTGVASDFGTSA